MAVVLLPAVLVVLGYVVALAVPASRTRLAQIPDRSPDVSLAEWAGVQIPWGTVYPEELIFRATLDPLLESTLGPTGNIMGAMLFGLWHIEPARAAGDDVATTVAATAVAGAALSELRRRTGTVRAPALLHLAVNAGGAIAPRLAVRLARRAARAA
ncbi:CPBP family intramembrane glutamic endopeptidase [Nocardia sp. BMG111209]|uniref:CPBP family intramembrane glutamic endopeptidase n=1 Tax=Nocardia sp. BMG111209 TaxID=1160137 RepID=UPI0003626927|nr:CPBP family intramembrane glutamic endopeptidase [Nocardia sp. BMG111209]